MIIYSPPKKGKTTIVSKLTTEFAEEGKAIILSLDPNGTAYADSIHKEISNPQEFVQALKTMEKMWIDGNGYEYLIVDTISMADEWSEIVGTFNYMATTQGKKFNKTDDGKTIPYGSKEFQTVHALPNGAGYLHSRSVMNSWLSLMKKAAPHIILIAHIKDKLVSSKAGDTVTESDIDLTGKVKSVYTSKVDAIAYFTRKKNQGFLNFKPAPGAKTVGGRCDHLNDSILISEKLDDGSVKTYWENIFLS